MKKNKQSFSTNEAKASFSNKQSLRQSLKQKIYYDKETDVLWLFIKSGPEEKHQEVAPGVSVELNKKGELLGIEILNASKVLGSKLGLKPPHYYRTSVAHSIKVKP